jgi:hypothetical protein
MRKTRNGPFVSLVYFVVGMPLRFLIARTCIRDDHYSFISADRRGDSLGFLMKSGNLNNLLEAEETKT